MHTAQHRGVLDTPAPFSPSMMTPKQGIFDVIPPDGISRGITLPFARPTACGLVRKAFHCYIAKPCYSGVPDPVIQTSPGPTAWPFF